MTTIVNTATLQKLSIGQKVLAKAGKDVYEGVIVEIRDNCEFPVFIKESDGIINAFKWHEVK